MSKVVRWNGKDKPDKNLEFTIHYSDGTSERIKDGVLFTVNDNHTMDIHVGVKELWKLFGVYLCFMDFLTRNKLISVFDDYLKTMMKQYEGGDKNGCD